MNSLIKEIDGYDEMTAEDKLKALEGIDVERYKKSATKANSEAAEWKRKYNALLSDEELKKQEFAEEIEEIKELNQRLLKEKTFTEQKANFLKLGYGDFADDAAKALTENDTSGLFAVQQKFLKDYSKKLEAELLKGTPKPPAGDGGKAKTKEDLKKMSPSERLQFSIENPEEYKKIYGG